MTAIRSAVRSALSDSQTRTTGLLVLAIAVAVVVFGVSHAGFLSAYNLLNIAVQTAVISVIAFGMTGVIIVRGIDLSVGSSLALASVVGAQVLVSTDGQIALTIVAILGTALVVSAVNGFLLAVLRVNPFMATLGMLALARGAAISISGGASVAIDDPVLLSLGRDAILGVPYSLIVTVVVLVGFGLLLDRTLLGRWFFAVGGNRRAAIASGIPTRAVEFSAFLLLGVVVAIGALLTIGRAGSAQPMAGLGLEFSAITAAVIGGASLAGGRGSIPATFLGSIFVGVLSSGLSFAGVSQPLIYVYTGMLTVLAVIVAQREVLGEFRDNLVYGLNRIRALRSRREVAASANAETVKGNLSASHTLRIDDIRKSFSGVEALKGVGFEVRSGEVVALMGENGAGKSTLVKVVAGNHQPTSGSLVIDGTPVTFAGPDDARKAGIAVIHQHFSLVPELTVSENLFLGQELRVGRFGPLRRRQMLRETQTLLDELQMPFMAKDSVASLSVGHRQMIEIVRAVREDAWLVIMDEPTSALSSREREHLYELIGRLTARGTAILYISHKMDEIYHLCSRAVVLRDGMLVGSPSLTEMDSAGLVSLMVGRDVDDVFPHTDATAGEIVVRVDGARDGRRLQEATLTVREGEVVGLVGLMGAGRTELLEAIAGLNPLQAGRIELLGGPVAGVSLDRLARRGLAFVPEDRHDQGIFPEMTVSANMSMLWLRRTARFGWLPGSGERSRVAELMDRMGVRPKDPTKLIKHLSGGNQQKVVLGKWLAMQPKVILLDDPTRGVDVGAKAEIHGLIAALKAQGTAVIVTSSEIPEVLAIADRVVVMRAGFTVSEHARGVTEVTVMNEAFGDDGEALLVEAETHLQESDR